MEKSISSIMEGLQADLEELDKFIASSNRPNIKRQLEEQRKIIKQQIDDEKRKLEVSKATLEKTAENLSNPTKSVVYESINKYSFLSEDKFVKVYLTDNFAGLKDHPKEKINSDFKENAFEVYINDWKGRNFKYACYNLNKNIIPSESYVKATNSGLTVFLKKVKAHDHWDSLDKKKSLIKEPSLGENKDPSAGLMDMMKNMYESGDDNMKRMIAESWTKAQSEKKN